MHDGTSRAHATACVGMLWLDKRERSAAIGEEPWVPVTIKPYGDIGSIVDALC